MGNSVQAPSGRKNITKFDINLMCQKIRGYMEIEQGRFSGTFKTKEMNELIPLMKKKYPEYIEIKMQAKSNIKSMNNIKLTAFALRYVKVIEERSLMIENCLNKGNYDDLDFLATYLEGLIHIMRKINFKFTQNVEQFIFQFLKPKDVQKLNSFQQMNNDLRQLSKEPDYKQVNQYLEGVVARHKLNFDMQDYMNNNKVEIFDDQTNDPEDIKNYIKGGTIDIQDKTQNMNMSEEEQFLKVVQKIKLIGV